ncbi:hypothetical protein OWV82_006516 [Melia azedarach]|uniref:Uncharacterized protein n=1 Tax=Melia azedarach TaxID=155640 RepID=A0ACC1YI45_MELAZ|nr:hypothetical protein OWV82_006516 [Melia azedarach]
MQWLLVMCQRGCLSSEIPQLMPEDNVAASSARSCGISHPHYLQAEAEESHSSQSDQATPLAHQSLILAHREGHTASLSYVA